LLENRVMANKISRKNSKNNNNYLLNTKHYYNKSINTKINNSKI